MAISFGERKARMKAKSPSLVLIRASILERLPRRINLREQRLRRSRAASAQTMGFRLVVSHERALLYRATSWGKILYDIIQSAYTLASKSTGRKYQIRFEGGKLSVQEKALTVARLSSKAA